MNQQLDAPHGELAKAPTAEDLALFNAGITWWTLVGFPNPDLQPNVPIGVQLPINEKLPAP